MSSRVQVKYSPLTTVQNEKHNKALRYNIMDRLRGDSRCIIDSNEIRPEIFATKIAQGIVHARPGRSR
jgi:hypothetical protein